MHFHPAQSCFPLIQGHPTCTDPFIKHSHGFVRVNSNTPVGKKKEICVFQLLCSTRELLKVWREWSFLVMFNLVSKDA